jgi:hypothetical protein
MEKDLAHLQAEYEVPATPGGSLGESASSRATVRFPALQAKECRPPGLAKPTWIVSARM